MRLGCRRRTATRRRASAGARRARAPGSGVGRVADDDVVAHLAVLRIGHLVDVPELHRLAAQPVVLLEPAGHRPEGAGHLALGRQVDRGRPLDERALLGRQLEPVDQRPRRRQGTALDHLGPRQPYGLAEAEEELRVRLVAAGDPPRLLLVDALRELSALLRERTVGVHRAHGAGNSRTCRKNWTAKSFSCSRLSLPSASSSQSG